MPSRIPPAFAPLLALTRLHAADAIDVGDSRQLFLDPKFFDAARSVTLADKAVRPHVLLRDADLYAFQFRPAQPNP